MHTAEASNFMHKNQNLGVLIRHLARSIFTYYPHDLKVFVATWLTEMEVYLKLLAAKYNMSLGPDNLPYLSNFYFYYQDLRNEIHFEAKLPEQDKVKVNTVIVDQNTAVRLGFVSNKKLDINYGSLNVSNSFKTNVENSLITAKFEDSTHSAKESISLNKLKMDTLAASMSSGKLPIHPRPANDAMSPKNKRKIDALAASMSSGKVYNYPRPANDAMSPKNKRKMNTLAPMSSGKLPIHPRPANDAMSPKNKRKIDTLAASMSSGKVYNYPRPANDAMSPKNKRKIDTLAASMSSGKVYNYPRPANDAMSPKNKLKAESTAKSMINLINHQMSDMFCSERSALADTAAYMDLLRQINTIEDERDLSMISAQMAQFIKRKDIAKARSKAEVQSSKLRGFESTAKEKEQGPNATRRIAIANDASGMGQSYVPPVFDKPEGELNKLLQSLCESTLFSNMSPEEQMDIAKAMKAITIPAGESILKQGCPSNDLLYYTMRGTVSIIKDGKVVALEGEGKYFGEMELANNVTECAATVRTNTEVHAYILEKATYTNLVLNFTMRNREKFKALVSRVAFFSELPDYEKLILAEALTTEEFNSGDHLIRIENPTPWMYISTLSSAAQLKWRGRTMVQRSILQTWGPTVWLGNWSSYSPITLWQMSPQSKKLRWLNSPKTTLICAVVISSMPLSSSLLRGDMRTTCHMPAARLKVTWTTSNAEKIKEKQRANTHLDS